MASTINTNLVFIDSMYFMNCSLDFKEFSVEFLEPVKQKGFNPYEYMDSFKTFSENNLPDRSKFFSSLKDVSFSEKGYWKDNG